MRNKLHNCKVEKREKEILLNYNPNNQLINSAK